MSADSRVRLERNPLRILDSKDPGDRDVIDGAPPFDNFLNETSRVFFDTVRSGLDALGVCYQRNTRLVRGLDYYCHSAFEFVTTDLGAQGTVLGGGRYDGLVHMLGGPDLPGVGWAAGIERLALLIAEPPAGPPPVAVIPVGPAAEAQALVLTQRLRHAGFTVDLGYSGNVGKRMKRADKLAARVALVLGDDELARGAVTLRDLARGEQSELPLVELEERLRQVH